MPGQNLRFVQKSAPDRGLTYGSWQMFLKELYKTVGVFAITWYYIYTVKHKLSIASIVS